MFSLIDESVRALGLDGALIWFSPGTVVTVDDDLVTAWSLAEITNNTSNTRKARFFISIFRISVYLECLWEIREVHKCQIDERKKKKTHYLVSSSSSVIYIYLHNMCFLSICCCLSLDIVWNERNERERFLFIILISS